MTEYLHRCLMAPAAWADAAHELCAKLSDAGGGMFTIPLSPSGEKPATDFINAGCIGADFCTLLPLTAFDTDGVATTTPGQPAVIVVLAAEAGIGVTLAQIEALLAAVEVTEESWQAALDRRNLKLVTASLL